MHILVLLIFIFMFGIKISKRKIYDPICLFYLIWAIALFFYSILYENYSRFGNEVFYVLIYGAVSFEFSYYISQVITKNGYEVKPKIINLKDTILLLLIINFVASLLLIKKAIFIINQIGLDNKFMALRWGLNYSGYNYGIVSYFANISFITTLVIYIYLLKYSHKRKVVLYFLISLITTMIFAILSTGRGFIFSIVLCLFGAYCIIKRPNTKKISKVILLMSGFLFMVFLIYAIVLDKNYTLESNSLHSNSIINTLNNLGIYVSANIQALDYWITYESGSFQYGLNSFRTILAIFKKVGLDITVVDLVKDYSLTAISVNTYTLYQTYINDFGILAIGIFQMIFGYIHGYSYNRALRNDLKYIFAYSLLIFPLIMQIMLDQYFSLLSTWIQYIILYCIFFKTSFFFTTINDQ